MYYLKFDVDICFIRVSYDSQDYREFNYVLVLYTRLVGTTILRYCSLPVYVAVGALTFNK